MPFDSLPTDNPVLDLLTRARAHIEAGWCQGALAKADQVCTLGALYKADGIDLTNPKLSFKYLQKHLSKTADTTNRLLTETTRQQHHTDPATFNDRSTTTQADVLALYDLAIAQCIQTPK